MSIPTADGEVNFTEMTVSTRPSSDIGVYFTHVGTGILPGFPISNYQSIDGASMQTSVVLRGEFVNLTIHLKFSIPKRNWNFTNFFW